MWWVGGYGPDLGGIGTGIGVLQSRDNGSLEYAGVAVKSNSPSYLAEANGHVYSADEASMSVSSFRRAGAKLVRDATTASSGSLPCHLALLDDAIVVANYGSGTIGVIALKPSGAVGKVLDTVPSPTVGGHAHSSLRLPPNTLVSADLGADCVLVHSVDGRRLTRIDEIPFPPGTGPRDLAVHPDGLVFVLGQLAATLTVLAWEGGTLAPVSAAGLPGAVPGDDAAAIGFGPGGFVYAGLRGSNRVSVLHLTAANTLEPVGWVPAEGDWPRHLAVDGDLLHVANQLSSTVSSFRLGADGMPKLISDPEVVPSPTFLLKALV